VRIASLLPSATEIVCALGLRTDLVGVSHECDFPPDVVGLPVLTEAKLDPRGDSASIDAAVRRLVQDGLSVYRIKTDVLAAVDPDVIVTQEQCEVCAVSYAEVVAATDTLLSRPAAIVSLRPVRLADIFADVARVAEATGQGDAGRELVDRLDARIDAIRVRAGRVHSRPRVACIEWMDPVMVAGNWVPELVELAGGRYDLVGAGEHSPSITWDTLVAAQPDVVIVMACGFGLEQTRRELPRLSERPGWPELPAVRNDRVYAVDGNAYLNRPGPRIADSAELLAGLIQPGLFASKIPPGSYFKV